MAQSGGLVEHPPVPIVVFDGNVVRIRQYPCGLTGVTQANQSGSIEQMVCCNTLVLTSPNLKSVGVIDYKPCFYLRGVISAW